jgi:hypothetical protein
MLRLWNQTKADIERWLKTKELDFVQKDNINLKLTPRKYLDKYVFTDLHEVFFYEFPHILQEWIKILKYRHPKNQIRQLEWNSEEIAQLQRVDNKFTHTIDFWLYNIVVRFFTEFVVDTTKSYNTTEQELLKGPQSRYVITLIFTRHAYLASGHLKFLLCQNTAEQLFLKTPFIKAHVPCSITACVYMLADPR